MCYINLRLTLTLTLTLTSRLEDCEVPAVLVCQLTITAASSGNASLSFTISRYYFLPSINVFPSKFKN